MPYHIVKQGKKHCVAVKGGRTLKCYSDEKKAKAYLAALYFNVTAKEDRMANERGFIARLRDFVRDFVAGLDGFVDDYAAVEIERAVGMQNVYTQVATKLHERYPGAWIMDVYRDDGGELFLIYTEEGELYRCSIIESNSEYELSDPVHVMQEFPEIAGDEVERTGISLQRQANGRVRGYLIASTATINRVGEIDSRELHDNLNRRAEESGKYPYVDFFHLGENFRFGQVDFLARDDSVAIASFLFDDTPLGWAMVRAVENDPQYWGSSIEYWPNQEPEMVEVRAQDADGKKIHVSIPVYRDGTYQAITILPEMYAASLWTSMQFVQKETLRMNPRILEALRKLAGDDEELLRKFESAVDSTNRSIVDQGLVTREADAEDVAETPDPEGSAAEAVQPETEVSVELDDAAVAAIVDRVREVTASSDEALAAAIETLTLRIEELTATVGTLQAATEARARQLDERLAVVERDDTERLEEMQADTPRIESRHLAVTYRPRGSINGKVESADRQTRASYADVAEETLAHLS